MRSPGRLSTMSSPASAVVPHLESSSPERGTFASIWRWLCQHGLFILCIVLHVMLIAAHGALIVVDLKHDQYLAQNTLAANLAAFALTTGSTAIFKAFVIPLTLVTQSLALRRNYYIRQSLSALHEKSAAWLGLGSAMGGMWRQRKLRAAPTGVFLILSYLACLFALGSTFPSLITVNFVSLNDPVLSRITSSLWKVTPEGLVDAFPIVSMMPLLYSSTTSLGFQDGNIYDVPKISASKESSTYDATAVSFQVDCRAIENVRQAGAPNVKDGADVITYPFFIDENFENVEVIPAAGTLNILSALPINAKSTPPPTLIVAASGLRIVNDFNETVTQRSVLSTATLEPALTPDPSTCKGYCNPINTIQIVACDINAVNTTIEINDNTGTLTTDTLDAEQWEVWTPPAAPKQAYLASLGDFSTLSPQSDRSQLFSVGSGDGNSTSNSTLTLLEAAVWDYLNLYYVSGSEVTLGQLNDALQAAVGIVYWRAAFQLAVSTVDVSTRSFTGFQTEVNPFPAWAGFGLSIILLVLAILLTRPHKDYIPALDSFGSPGIVQLTWLLGRSETAQHFASTVTDPADGKLLETGKGFEVHMSKCFNDNERPAMRRRGQSDNADYSSIGTKTPGEEKVLSYTQGV